MKRLTCLKGHQVHLRRRQRRNEPQCHQQTSNNINDYGFSSECHRQEWSLLRIEG